MTLREIREKKKITQVELARRIGLTPPAVFKIEQRGTSKVTVMELIATALGYDFTTIRTAAKETQSNYNRVS